MDAREIAEQGTILRGEVGSGVHGVSIEGTDDHDEMGICIEPEEYVIGLKNFEQYIFRTQPEGVRSGPGDLDLTIYSLRKWLRLALHGNPSIIIPLFTPEEKLVVNTEWGERLRKEAPQHIASREAGKRFLGYLTSQKERLLGVRGGRHGGKGRPELLEAYGFDTKYAMHMCRLGMQGVEYLETGRLTLPMPIGYRNWLLDLRQGRIPQGKAVEAAEELEAQLKLLIEETSPLPLKPDYDWANAFLIEAYTAHWKSRDLEALL